MLVLLMCHSLVRCCCCCCCCLCSPCVGPYVPLVWYLCFVFFICIYIYICVVLPSLFAVFPYWHAIGNPADHTYQQSHHLTNLQHQPHPLHHHQGHPKANTHKQHNTTTASSRSQQSARKLHNSWGNQATKLQADSR